jgi:hypothetical protein
MPVDLVLAISHNRVVREREWRQKEQEKRQQKKERQEEINKKLIEIGYYNNISKDNDKNKDKICLELFKIW